MYIFDGSYDRQVTVSSENAGGIKGGNKYIRSVGKTKTFYMNKSSSKDITYKFVATEANLAMQKV